MSIEEKIEGLKEELLSGFGIEDKCVPSIPLPSVGRIVHYYGGDLILPEPDSGPFAALVVDVTESMTVTLKITDPQGRDHVRANVKYGDPGWMWPPRV